MFRSFRILNLFLSVLVAFVFSSQLLSQRMTDNLSFGPAPHSEKTKVESQHITFPTEVNIGYGNDAIAGPFVSVPIPAGTPINTVGGNFSTAFLAGGDFNDAGVYYACTYGGALGVSTLITVDVTTGTPTTIGAITGITQYPTALDFNTANDTWYFGETDGVSSKLYTIDVNTGAATLVGTLTGVAGLIGMAIDCDGNAYGVDIGSDQIFSINLSTAAATAIGPMGFDASYAQDADFDASTGTLYLAAYNVTLSAGEFRSANLSTGATTLITSWGAVEIDGFAIDNPCGPPCPVGSSTNPSPANGTTGVSITTPGNATWTNGAGATAVEVFFGPVGNVVSVYSGTPISSLAIPAPLQYATTYQWRVVCKNDTCSAFASTWSFTTEQDPFYTEVVDTLYPQAAQYWTGTTNGTAKTDGEVRGVGTEDGWFMFDVSSIPDAATIMSVNLNGYVNLTNYPYWSATPLPGLNPLTATALELKTAIEANSGTTLAYVYSNETSTFTTGWKTYPLAGTVNADLQSALGQEWFAMGMDSRDNSATYYINWDGWSQVNIPYLVVQYSYVTPVELTSFAATTDNRNVTLNWSTATELNNSGFQVERSNGSAYEVVGFVAGHGTTSEVRNYSFVDQNVVSGSYSYRLKQVDFNGTFEYSNVIEVEVVGVKEFALGQNYPNPFNPSTTINFSLATDSKVSLKIFDVLGQEVATLLNGQLAAGNQTVSFDASSLNSGVYFYRIDASGVDGQKFSSTKKMILTK